MLGKSFLVLYPLGHFYVLFFLTLNLLSLSKSHSKVQTTPTSHYTTSKQRVTTVTCDQLASTNTKIADSESEIPTPTSPSQPPQNMEFSVTQSAPATMVRPIEPTPHDVLDLSAIDRLPGLRCKVRTIHVYRRGVRPGKVIKEAIAKALVQYYPLAGKLVESSQGELQISCTGDGVWFEEATANCELVDVNYLDHPFVVSPEDLLPCPGSEIDQSSVLVLMKVTEFKCGGFVIGLEFCHSICDGLGASRFLSAVGELARGISSPTIKPVWCRESIPTPPKPNSLQFHNFETQNLVFPTPTYNLEKEVIDLPIDQIRKFKTQFFDSTGLRCSVFEILAACTWQCRTRATVDGNDPDVEMKLVFFANVRSLINPPLPPGFYGNCFFPVSVTASAEVLREASKFEVVQMIQAGKGKLEVELGKWAVGEGSDPYIPTLGYTTLFVSEWSRLGFGEVDYGWGTAEQLVPLTYSDVIPICIVGSQPGTGNGGVRLITQCVQESHMIAFRDRILEMLA